MFAWVLILFSIFPLQKTATVTVEIKGFPNDKGEVFIAVYDENDEFPVFGKQSKGVKLKIEKGKATTQFSLHAEKKYAIAVFHDQNKNGLLDKNIFGAPTEAYGFSNNVRNLFSAPSFDQAKFTPSKEKSIQIVVQ